MVATYTQLLAERYKGKIDQNADKYIHYAVDGALRMQTLVKDLLALADSGERPWQGSLISGVPSALSEVLSVHGAKASARTVVLAGEALTARAVTAIGAALPGAEVRNIYGPTEATVYATSWRAGILLSPNSTVKLPASPPTVYAV